jgi:hypothetical protein
LICANHAGLAELAGSETFRVAVANLGHLPGSDSPLITRPESTLAAFRAVLERLDEGGALLAVIYVGHEGGRAECDAIEQWADELDPTHWRITWHRHPARVRHAPVVLIVAAP